MGKTRKELRFICFFNTSTSVYLTLHMVSTTSFIPRIEVRYRHKVCIKDYQGLIPPSKKNKELRILQKQSSDVCLSQRAHLIEPDFHIVNVIHAKPGRVKMDLSLVILYHNM